MNASSQPARLNTPVSGSEQTAVSSVRVSNPNDSAAAGMATATTMYVLRYFGAGATASATTHPAVSTPMNAHACRRGRVARTYIARNMAAIMHRNSALISSWNAITAGVATPAAITAGSGRCGRTDSYPSAASPSTTATSPPVGSDRVAESSVGNSVRATPTAYSSVVTAR